MKKVIFFSFFYFLWFLSGKGLFYKANSPKVISFSLINAACLFFLMNYQGIINYFKDGQIIDLGNRQLEVVYTPGHTMGSTTFID
mgnify:CR=1 FL=1